MSKLNKMVFFGDQNDMLREEIEPFDFANPIVDPVELAHTLIEVVQKEKGIGLAANQIGIRARAFVMLTDPPMVCFNPRITSYGEDDTVMEEGCLSYPGVGVKIKRKTNIRVRFQDPYGNPVVKKFAGMASRVFQHELDHLNGVEYYKRANHFHQERFKRKWKGNKRKIKSFAKAS